MLPKAWLAIIFVCLSGILSGQADSLTISPDSLILAKASYNELKELAAESLESSYRPYLPFIFERGNLYQNGYFHLGRPNLSPALRYGFEIQSTVFSPAIYHSYFSSFYPKVEQNWGSDYRPENYSFEPTQTWLHTSLGDYEQRFARAHLAKSGLLSYEGLAYQGDLLVQNGFWADLMSAETSHKHLIMLSTGKWNWEAEFASWNREISMAELLPVYWLSDNYSIDHKLSQVYASLAHPIFRLALMHTEEKAAALRFTETLRNSSTQAQFCLGNDNGVYRYQGLLEHAFLKANVSPARVFNTQRYQNKLSLSFEKYLPYTVSLNADLLDWESGRTWTQLSYPLGSFTLGAYAKLLWGKDLSPITVQDIYSRTGEMELMDSSIQREQAAVLSYGQLWYSASLAGGTKFMEQSADSPGFSTRAELPFFKLALDADLPWKSWQIKLNHRWNYTKFDPGLCENPEFSFTAIQNVFYNLPYNNALLGGFALQGHSGYYAANVVNPLLIEASTALDLWLGFQIDKLFELKGGFKNLLSSTLYGSMPVPLSAYAELKWFFFN